VTARVLLIALSAAVWAMAASDGSFQAEIAAWRLARLASLTADNGWLTVAGLFWLHPGANSFGSDPSSEIAIAGWPAARRRFQVRWASRGRDH